MARHEIEGRLFDYWPFGPRDPNEAHRASTPLELLFDLVTVIAVAAAARGLHHGIVEGHAAQAVPVFLIAFGAIWWAWINYTWYASAYDNDGPIYRLLTFWVIGGALLLSASVDRFFAGLDIRLPVLAYVIMRIGMIALWLNAARHDPARRATARRYACGIAMAQMAWIALALFAQRGSPLLFALMMIGWVSEFTVPVYAERAGATPWHVEHIIERYGLLMIITLGEIMLAGSMALAAGSATNAIGPSLVHIALAALVICGSMWWLYFSRDDHLRVHQHPRPLEFIWGYGHLVPLLAAAAVGALIAVMVDATQGYGAISLHRAKLAVAVPLALYMVGLWFVRDQWVLAGPARLVLPLAAVLVLLAGAWSSAALETTATLAAASVFVHSALATRERRMARAR